MYTQPVQGPGGQVYHANLRKRKRAAKLLGGGQNDDNNSVKRAWEEKATSQSPRHPYTNALKPVDCHVLWSSVSTQDH